MPNDHTLVHEAQAALLDDLIVYAKDPECETDDRLAPYLLELRRQIVGCIGGYSVLPKVIERHAGRVGADAACVSLLNGLVTGAILRAESERSDAARELFGKVMRYELALACLTSSDTLEGEVARRGAVTAALSAGREFDAVRLAELFLGEPQCPAELASALLELKREAFVSIRGEEEG